MVVPTQNPHSKFLYSVVMPNSYAAGGHPIDLSGTFSGLSSVQITRARITLTGQPDSGLYYTAETGTDTYANSKFRIMSYRVAGGVLAEVAAASNLSTITLEFYAYPY